MQLFDAIPRLNNSRIILRPLTPADVPALREITENPNVYRYLPTFLYEQKYDDLRLMIERLPAECLATQSSILFGVCLCAAPEPVVGIAEVYNYEAARRKVSIGYRLNEAFWGQGIATEVVILLKAYLLETAGINTITAHVMTDNDSSGRVLEKNGFIRNCSSLLEDWGRTEKVTVNKYIFKKRPIADQLP